MTIGRRIAKIRKETGLNQIDFASKHGVSQSAFKNYERGVTEPPIGLLADICEAYAVDIAWLALGEGKPRRVPVEKVMQQAVDAVDQYSYRAQQQVSESKKYEAVYDVVQYLGAHPNASDDYIIRIIERAFNKES